MTRHTVPSVALVVITQDCLVFAKTETSHALCLRRLGFVAVPAAQVNG